METKMSLQGIERTEWLHLRKTGLGGSDAGAVCGLNPYSSPLQVFYDKTSEEVQDKDSESMRQGRDLEEYVARGDDNGSWKKPERRCGGQTSCTVRKNIRLCLQMWTGLW